MAKYSTRLTLLEKIKNSHDEQSWEDFVHFYRHFIYSIIRKSHLPAEECEDLSQVVLLRLWQALPKFDYDQEKGGFRYWLYRVTQNVVNSELKKQISRKEKFEQNYLPDALMDSESKRQSDVEVWIESEWRIHISNLAYQNVLPQLSDKARRAFEMFLDDVPVEEIAQEIDIKVNSVYIYKNRVKEQIKAEIRHLKDQLE